jgi:hypothetical protein
MGNLFLILLSVFAAFMAFYDGPGDTGDNPPDPGDTGDNPPDPGDTGDNPPDPGDTGDNPPDPGDTGDNPTFTKEEVDAMVARRLAGQGKELKKAQARLAEVERQEEEARRKTLSDVEQAQEDAQAAQGVASEKDSEIIDLKGRVGAGAAAVVLSGYKVSEAAFVARGLPAECKELDESLELTKEAKAAIKSFLKDHPGLMAAPVEGDAPAGPGGQPPGKRGAKSKARKGYYRRIEEL